MNAYQRISKYKSVLMGIAIIIVLYGHYFYYSSGYLPYEQLNITMWYTIGSVDIFLFLSGFGIYHSLAKNDDPLTFMKRRLGRLLPSYLPYILVYCGYCMATNQMTKYQALGNLTTFGWWAQIGSQLNWYIPTMVGLYLFSPLFYQIIRQQGRKSMWMMGLFFLLDAGCVGSSLMIGVSRFPVYFLGMYLGREAMEGRKPSRTHLILSGVALVVSMVGLYVIVKVAPGTLSRMGFWWHPYLFSTPGCLYFTSWCLEKHEKWKPTALLNRGLAFLGNKSFEIYLVHLLVYLVAYNSGLRNRLAWVGVALLGLILGSLYSVVINKLTARKKK